MSRRRVGRRVDGILLLDKPSGFRSNEVLQRVKRLFKARKAGHTGSLDRLASGLLPLCFGEATKLSSFLLTADKSYRARVRLGQTTTTGDADGELTEERVVPSLGDAELRGLEARFTGEIEQIPPMHSALKVNGKRLYQLAYEGKEIERQPRPVTIFELALRSLSPLELELDVTCSKGTYVRTLAEDIGAAIGCGAHVAALRRIAVGKLAVSDAWTVERLEALAEEGLEALDAALLPTETAVAVWPRIALKGVMVHYAKQGQPILVPKAPTSGWVRLYSEADAFMGVGEILDDGRVAPRRLLQG